MSRLIFRFAASWLATLSMVVVAFSFAGCNRSLSSTESASVARSHTAMAHNRMAVESSTRANNVSEAANIANVVTIGNFAFSPQSLTVLIGTTVIWVNRDDVPHTVRDTKKRFHSEALDTDDTFSIRFTEAGEYSYFCGIHPHMTGKIIVK